MNDIQSTVEHSTMPTDLPITLDGPMPTALALYLNTALYERVKAVAVVMSKAEGVTPRHLLGKPEACFAVVSRAITWRLDPYAVAMSTYQTPGGQIGFEGKLIHAIIEGSGRLTRGIQYEHYGDWSKVQGRFKMQPSNKDGGKPYPVPTWTDDDARAGKPNGDAYPRASSCGVRVSAQVKGESQPRMLDFDLIQAQPRNSTLWATDPMTQICYTAVRRFGSVVAPSLLMGVPFDLTDRFEREPIDVTHEANSKVDDLNAAINDKAAKKPPAQPPQTSIETDLAGSPLSYAEVATALAAAERGKDIARLDEAVDLIRSVADPQQRGELEVEAKRVRKAIEGDQAQSRA